MFYGIYWGKELMKSIRTADFTRSNAATFLTSEMGLSLMLLMPRMEDEIIELELEREKRKQAGKNVTIADYEAVRKALWMPPLRWDEVCTLFATWSLLLRLLFGTKNAHLLGLNAIRRHVLSLAETKHRYSSTYFTNVVWCVLDNAVRWLNQVVPYDDLVSTTDVMCLQFPTTRLHRVAEMLGMKSEYTMATFPHEWQTYTERRPGHNNYLAAVSFGSGLSTAGSLSSSLRTITGNNRETGSSQSEGNKAKESPADKNKQHREKHPARYGKNAVNSDVQEDIADGAASAMDEVTAEVASAADEVTAAAVSGGRATNRDIVV